MVLRVVSFLPLFLVVCCWFRLNAAVPLSVHLRPPRQAREIVSEEAENVQEVGKETALRIRTRRDVSPMDMSFRRYHDSDEVDEEHTHERRHHRRPRKKIMISNQNMNMQIQRNEEDVGHDHRRQEHSKPKQTVPEDMTGTSGVSLVPTVHGKEEQNCAGGKKENERYSSSFAGNVSSTRRLQLEEDFDAVAKDHAGKKTSDVYMGEDITLCWIETMTVKEDQSFNPPKRIVIREYTISFENAATIPDRYLDCTRLPGEISAHDPDVGKTALFEIIDENTKVSKLVNFTAVSHIGDVLVWQHKRVKCGVGPVVTKHVVEWNEGGETPKKRVEIKVSPKIHQLSVASAGEPCVTESTIVGISTVSAGNYSKEEVFTELPVTVLPPAIVPVSTEEVPEESTVVGQREESTVKPDETVTDLPEGEVTVTTECSTGFTSLPSITTTLGPVETSTSYSAETEESSTEGSEVSSTTSETLSTEVSSAEVTELHALESTTSPTEFTEEPTTSTTESGEESTTSGTESAEESTTGATESAEETTTSATESAEESTTSTTELAEESTTGATESIEETTTSATESAGESTTSATESAEESTTSTTELAEESTTSTTELVEESTTSVTESTEESTTSGTESPEESTISPTELSGISTISPTESVEESTIEESSSSSVEEPSTESSTIFPTESTESVETEETVTFESSTEPSESSTPTASGEITSITSDYPETTTESEEICPDDSSGSCLVDSQETSTSPELSTTESIESSTTEAITTESTENGGESSEESVSESPESTTVSTEGLTESVSDSSTEGPESTTESTVFYEEVTTPTTEFEETITTGPANMTISGGLSASVSITGNHAGERTFVSTTVDPPISITSSSSSCEDDSGCACERDGSCSQPSSAETSALSTIIETLTESLGLRKKTTAVPDSLRKIFTKSSDETNRPGMITRHSTASGKIVPTGTSMGMTTPTVPCDESLGSCSQKGSLESCDGSENCSPTDSTEPCDKSSGSCSEETDSSVKGTTPTYGNIVFPATTIPVSRESYNVSSSIDNVPTTVETRRSTPLSSVSTSSPDHKLILKIRVLLEHTNENQEKQNLVEVEKHLLLNENPKDRGHVDLLEQIKSLNKSVNMQAIKALLNCTSLGQLAEDTNQLVSSQLDMHVKPAGLLPSVNPSHAKHTVPGNLNPPANDFYHKPSMHSRHKDSDYDDTRRRKRSHVDTKDEENIRTSTKIRERRYAQDDEANIGSPKSRKNRIAEWPNTRSNFRNETNNVPQIHPVVKEVNGLSRKNASKDKNEKEEPARNLQITDSSEIDAIRESLPGMQEDVMAGLQHVFSELSVKDLQPVDEKVGDNIPKSKLLDVVADPKDKRVHQRQRRSTMEEVGRWSNERIRKVPSGDKLRSFTEFTIYKDHS